jgi:hypothetical protein
MRSGDALAARSRIRPAARRRARPRDDASLADHDVASGDRAAGIDDARVPWHSAGVGGRASGSVR